MTADLLLTGLGDARRDARGTLLLERMVAHESACLRRVAHSRADEVAFSRLLASEHLDQDLLRTRLRDGTARRCFGRAHVLVLQDTTEINYQHHARSKRGLGPVGNGRDQGLFVHGLLAVDAEGGGCLGLVDAMPWVRTPRVGDHRTLPVEDKESRRWLLGAAMAATLTGMARQVTVIGDRESDLYEIFARRPHERCHVLVRACRNRTLAGGRRLYERLDALPACLGYQVAVPPRAGRPGHSARVLVRYGEVTIPRPRRSREAVREVALSAVTVSEEGTASQRLCWRLLTTHAVTSPEMAVRVVDWYRQRWHIEQLFRVLKRQGLDLEASQSVHAGSLCKLAVLSAHAAARIHQLVLARDGGTPVPAGELFDPSELATMAALIPQYEGKTEKQKNPHPPETLAWCAWIIARLGGWKGYRHSEGPPGPLTMQRGYERFAAIHEGYKLAAAQNVCKP
ncbi:IS4 family transposase [Azospirillum sp. SYSU D00513]|uniref:IS4 family transposase n=1 Tax=Azospirillum sp. SYSU D00513 TaxID=2812561 RepID=UPI001A9621DC|nr:IS4 family transposase [Azospirillum sp. SYSU D00513]